MSNRPSAGRRIRRNAEETDMFDHRHQIRPSAGRTRRAKAAAMRRDRRNGRQHRWDQGPPAASAGVRS